MAQTSIRFTVKWRWWLKHYFLGVLLMARLTGREPNWDRFSYWVRKGITITAR